MKNILRAEFKKIQFLAVYRNLLLTAVILSLVFGALLLLTVGVTEGRELSSLNSLEVIDVSFLGIDVTAIMMIIFSALYVSKDISGSAVYTNLTMTPNRLKFFISRILFLTLLSILMSIVVIALIFMMDYLIMSLNNMGSLDLFNHSVYLKILGSILMVIVYGLFSAFGSFFTQSMSGGVVFSLGLMFIPALIRFFPEWVGDIVLPIFPESAIAAFIDITNESNPLIVALLVLSIWIIASGLVSYLSFRQRDY